MRVSCVCPVCVLCVLRVSCVCPACRAPYPTDDPPVILSEAVLQRRGPSSTHRPSVPRLACSAGPAEEPASGGGTAASPWGLHRRDVSLCRVEERQTAGVECVE